MRKLLLIGWDAADWKAINPLMDAGLMPNLEKLVNNGVMGNLASLDPPLSPMLWTSISTGKRPYKHGIHGFSEPTPENDAIRPVYITSRKVKAIWNILTQKGLKTHQVGWWPSHPAEPINGISISNLYQKANKPITEPWDMLPGTVHPAEKSDIFKDLRIHHHELTQAHILPFIPKAAELDQTDKIVQKRIDSIRKITAHAATVQAAATYIIDQEEWDFTAVYFDAIDHYAHGFMKFNPPRRPHIPEDVYEFYKDVVSTGYRYHDMMLGSMLEMLDDDTTIMLISDHGFHPGDLRPTSIPKEPAGPAIEHSPYGIFVISGPGIKKDERIYGASLLDITPTLLQLYGLPVGQDMDGKVLVDIFEKTPNIQVTPSWENVAGACGMHPSYLQEDSYDNQEALQQLIELGYIEAPGADIKKAITRTTNENKYYLAISYMDGRKYEEAIRILSFLYKDNPTEERYGRKLAAAYLQTQQATEARAIVQQIISTKERESPSLFIMMGLVNLSENKAQRALEYFQKADFLAPNNPVILSHLGQSYLRLAQWDKAKDAFNKSLEIDSENEQSWHGLGLACLRSEHYESAAEYLLNSIGLLYYQPFVHYHFAETLYHLEDYERSATAFEICLRMMPGLNKARNWLIKLYEGPLDEPVKAVAMKQMMKENTKQEILIVSGLPRSGTSMMMQMLEAGGIEPYTDGKRLADENNPKGYYELEAVKGLIRDPRFLDKTGDKVVKVISPLLTHLPDKFRYKIIFMERDLDEILHSQSSMLIRQGKIKKETFSLSLLSTYKKSLEKVRQVVTKKPTIEILWLNYADVLDNPDDAGKQINTFLGKELDVSQMAAVVDPSLYREKAKQ